MNSNVIENKVSVCWEIWVEYNDFRVEKMATVYRYEMVQDVVQMLRDNRDAENVNDFYVEKVSK